MQKKIALLALSLYIIEATAFTQTDSAVSFKGAIKENRIKLQRNIIQYTIIKNLSLALSDDTEDNWADAFGGIELLRYKSPWTDGRIMLAFDSIEKRSTGFQRALLELAYSCCAGRFTKPVSALLFSTGDAKIFAMCAAYLLLNNGHLPAGIHLDNKKQQLIKNDRDEAIFSQLLYRLQSESDPKKRVTVAAITGHDFLKGHTVLYSFQRKNRDYPGLALVRDTAGHFTRDEKGNVFSVPQLARSIGNLPGFLTNGNTPQGIFRMYGFDTSKTYFIGPTANIQLTMPFETSLQHFFNDSTITDSVWTEAWYQKLLTPALKIYQPLYESFYAGKAGRTEIIAHGTTVDPEYYAGEIYYPQTPTAGCLCTKEIWSGINGQRLESDQQKLANAVQAAGGPDGYCVVIEIDDAQKPVALDEVLALMNSIDH